MKNMVILVDTNILLDFIQERKPFVDEADRIIRYCSTHVVAGFIAAHSVTNIFFILRKDYSVDKRKALLMDICRSLPVIGIDQEKIMASLMNESFADIEDCLQDECALSIGADYIVTRNIDDFRHSAIPAILPEGFLAKLEAAHE